MSHQKVTPKFPTEREHISVPWLSPIARHQAVQREQAMIQRVRAGGEGAWIRISRQREVERGRFWMPASGTNTGFWTAVRRFRLLANTMV